MDQSLITHPEPGLKNNSYLMSHPFAFFIGVWAFLCGLAALALLLSPPFGWAQDQQSALAILFPNWAELLWATMYTIGGGMLAYGIAGLKLRFEVAGCWMIAGTQIVNVYTVLVIRGVPAAFISGVGMAVGVGLLMRSCLLLRNRRS